MDCLYVRLSALEVARCGGKASSIRNAMTQPDWATLLIKDVLFLHNRTKAPKIEWKVGGGSGVTKVRGVYKRRGYKRVIKYRRGTPNIIVRVNGDLARSKLVLLHELSHWLLRAQHWHDKAFWKKAWELYYIFLTKEEFEEARKDEFGYKGKASIVYHELFG